MYDPRKPETKAIREIAKITGNARSMLFLHVDGIGTKGVYHWRRRTFLYAAQDAFAMNWNDALVEGARIVALVDHIMVPVEDQAGILETVQGLADECVKKGIVLCNGETAIRDDMQGIEVSVTVYGQYLWPRVNYFRPGDILVGLRSYGLHSNGFTKVREVFGDEYRAEFVMPTCVYPSVVHGLARAYDASALVHITGGAYTRLKHAMQNVDILIGRHGMTPHGIFYELHGRGVSDEDMYTIFNCGVGFIIGVARERASSLVEEFGKRAWWAGPIGQVIRGNGAIFITSAFSGKEIAL